MLLLSGVFIFLFVIYILYCSKQCCIYGAFIQMVGCVVRGLVHHE